MKKVLFVCLGNICRSPTAEAIFKAIILDEGLEKEIYVDSAATSGHHAGEMSDTRMQEHALKRAYELNSRSREVVPQDFTNFDFILAMDDDNLENLKLMDGSDGHHDKLHRMVDYCSEYKVDEVPDPYYGGSKGFERVLNILEDACYNLIETVKKS